MIMRAVLYEEHPHNATMRVIGTQAMAYIVWQRLALV